MNIKIGLLAALCLWCGLSSAEARARRPPRQRAAPGKTSAVAGIRRHVEHSAFPQLPFARRDMSYALAWEAHDQNGLWQLGLNYTPDVGDATNDVRYVATPFANLLLKDGSWLAGLGILSSYIVTEQDKDWSSLYWQFLIGFNIPIGEIEFDVMAYYPFKSWSRLGDFSSRDIEFGALVRYTF